MNEAQQQRLSANIHLLGDMLGEIIIEQEGQAVFELEEQVRALSKASANRSSRTGFNR